MASTPINSTYTSPALLNIPCELRLRIFEELILDQGQTHHCHYGNVHVSQPQICHPLLLTCTTLSEEYRTAQRKYAIHVMNISLNGNKDMEPSVSHFIATYLHPILSVPRQIRHIKIIVTLMETDYNHDTTEAAGTPNTMADPSARIEQEGFPLNIPALLSPFKERFPRVDDIHVELRFMLLLPLVLELPPHSITVRSAGAELGISIEGRIPGPDVLWDRMAMAIWKITNSFLGCEKLEVEWVDDGRNGRVWWGMFRKGLWRPLVKLAKDEGRSEMQIVVLARSGIGPTTIYPFQDGYHIFRLSRSVQ